MGLNSGLKGLSCNVTALTTGRNTATAIYMNILWYWVCENPMHTRTFSGQSTLGNQYRYIYTVL